MFAFINSFYITFVAFAYSIMVFFLGKRENFTYYGMNPKELTPEIACNDPVLLIHGRGGNQSCWLPLAKRLQKDGIAPVYTLNLPQENWKECLVAKIMEIRNQYSLVNGKDSVVRIHIIGHSLGAIYAVNYAFSGEDCLNGIRFGKIISIAGRLKVTKTRAQWIFRKFIPIINEAYKNLRKKLHLDNLYIIGGENDSLVPQEAIFVHHDDNKQLLVKDHGHLSVIYAPVTHDKIVSILKSF